MEQKSCHCSSSLFERIKSLYDYSVCGPYLVTPLLSLWTLPGHAITQNLDTVLWKLNRFSSSSEMVGFGGHMLSGSNSKSFSKSRGNLHQLTTFTHGTQDQIFLISDFRRDLNIVYFLLGISPALNCSWPTFRNPVSIPSSKAGCTVYCTPSLWRWNCYRVPKRRPTTIWRRGNTQKKIYKIRYFPQVLVEGNLKQLVCSSAKCHRRHEWMAAKLHMFITSSLDEGQWLASRIRHFRYQFNLLETKRNLLYIRNQSVPRCKHFPPRL